MGNKEIVDLSPMHTALLDMLQWFHSKCVENGLRYYVVGGTMLGTIRHKGFIPWDDDIDVAMPRKDYDIFIKKFSSKATSQYSVEVPEKCNLDYTYVYAKLYNTQTTLVEHRRKIVKRGIYIDIFPLDGIGNSINEAYENYKKIYRLNRLHDTMVCAFRKERKWYKNISIFLGRIVSPLFISERMVNMKITKKCMKYDFDESEYVGNLVGNWGYKEIMPRSFFGIPKEYDFEGITVLGVEKPHEYLTSLYNDYMQLPPIEKRVSHHEHILNRIVCIQFYYYREDVVVECKSQLLNNICCWQVNQ